MFDWLARLVLRGGVWVVLAWAAAAAVLHATAPSWESVSKDDDVRFFPEHYRTVIGQDLLEKGFPGDASSSSIVLVAARADGKLTEEDRAYVLEVTRRIKEFDRERGSLGFKENVLNFRSPVVGSRLVGDAKVGDGQATLVIVSLDSTYLSQRARVAVQEFLKFLDASIRPEAPPGLQFAVTGSAVVGHDLNTASVQSIHKTTVATVALVVIILLLVYRSPFLALIPLVSIAASVWMSRKAITLLTLVPGLNFQVINITSIFVVVVLFGAGTDYCLFLISRYREELRRGRSSDEALGEAIRKVAGALVASAGTVIVGLSLLSFCTFQKIRNTGPAIGLSLAISLAASLTLAPILIRLLRPVIFWPFKPPRPLTPAEAGEARARGNLCGTLTEAAPDWGTRVWLCIAKFVAAYPGTVLGLSLALLVPFAWVGYGTKPNYSQLDDLGATLPSVQGSRVIGKYFAVGELSPTTLLVEHESLGFRTPEGRAAVERLTNRLAAVPGVAEARSLSRPTGTPTPPPEPIAIGSLGRLFGRGTDTLARAVAENRYVSSQPLDPSDRERITRIELSFASDPFASESLGVLEELSAAAEEFLASDEAFAGSVKAWGLSGATPSIEDLKRVTRADERRMYWLVTLGVYLILVALLRRPWICVYLMFTVVLSYLAALGVTELVFRNFFWNHAAGPWNGLDWKVGFFLFVILIAVGEDYNIFLMSRVLEEQREHGVLVGTKRAVAYTGGIITSCGLIMAGTFGSMLTGDLMALRELGFALALGVALDTFLVRPVLVPAFLILAYRLSGREAMDLEAAPFESVATISIPPRTFPASARPGAGPTRSKSYPDDGARTTEPAMAVSSETDANDRELRANANANGNGNGRGPAGPLRPRPGSTARPLRFPREGD